MEDRKQRLVEFVAWTAKNIKGDEKGEAQIFLDRLFRAFGQPGCLDVGGQPEFRIRKAKEDGGGTAFADYVWKAVADIDLEAGGHSSENVRRWPDAPGSVASPARCVIFVKFLLCRKPALGCCTGTCGATGG